MQEDLLSITVTTVGACDGALLGVIVSLWISAWRDHVKDCDKHSCSAGKGSYRQFMGFYKVRAWSGDDSELRAGSGNVLYKWRFVFNNVFMVLGPWSFLLANHVVSKKIARNRRNRFMPFKAVVAKKALTGEK